jgi:hypothetical protein
MCFVMVNFLYCFIQAFPPIVPVEALLWCNNRLFSGGLDEQLHEHNIETGHIRVIFTDKCFLLFTELLLHCLVISCVGAQCSTLRY